MLNFFVIVLLFFGLLFFTGGTIGILRFPDFYTRLHAAGKLDTMGLLVTMSAAALYALHDLSVTAIITALKILFTVAFVFITSPTATHAIIDAGIRAGLAPWTKKGGAIQ